MEHSFSTFWANTGQSAKVPKDPWDQVLWGLGKGIFRAGCSAQVGVSDKGDFQPNQSAFWEVVFGKEDPGGKNR